MEGPKLDSLHACTNCGLSQGIVLKECSQCRMVAYCSKKCQIKHWKSGGHKNRCERSDGNARISPSQSSKSEASLSGIKDKKDSAASISEECANCGLNRMDLVLCSRCLVVKYCDKGCQSQHWRKGGHKQFCVAPEERRPEAVAAATSLRQTTPSKGETQCTICLDSIQSLCDATTLSCGHKFHATCVDSLRKFGVSKVCPVCRGELEGAEELVSNALQRFLVVYRQVEQAQKSWQTLTPTQQQEIDQVIATWQGEAKQGHADAQFHLSIIYARGYGVDKSDKEAARLTRLAAKQGHAEAQFNLGVMYNRGQGEEKNDKEAARWFRLAAARGDAQAQFSLGLLYFDGHGVKENYKVAARWFRFAAEQGHADAQFNLAVMSHEGRGVAKNYKESARLYRLAAEQGDAQAQCNLGKSYISGHGVEKNHHEASRWYRLAAEQGHVGAQSTLGMMLLHGLGVEKKYKEAARWCRLAAEQGDAEAQFSLGLMYFEGHGVEEHYEEAARWNRLAAEQGHAKAKCIPFK